MTRKIKNVGLLEECKCSANDCRQNERRKRLEGRENVRSVINGSSTWMAASFSGKKTLSRIYRSHSGLLKREHSVRFTGRSRKRERENLGNWFGGWETRRELYSLDLHHRRTIVLRNELEMVPRRFALALEFRDVRRQLIEIDFRGSRYCTNLKAEPRWRYRERYSNCLRVIYEIYIV